MNLDSEFRTADEKWEILEEPGDLRSKLLNYAKTKLIPELAGRYGRCDSRFGLKGIEFRQDWPETRYPSNGEGSFEIWLSLDCDQEPPSYRAVFQLAHECLHALKPVQLGRATVLEEGLVTEFSLEVVPCNIPPESKAYATAFDYVRKLRKLLPNLNSVISGYRSNHPGRGISDIDRGDLRRALAPNKQIDFDNCSELVDLTTSFEYWRNLPNKP